MVLLTPIDDQAASSSACNTHQSYNRRYDVFLSFRGEDTRFKFTGNLYNALHQKGINTFFDDTQLKIGDQFSDSLLKAIEESSIAIVVLSQHYASSTWCLEELCKILECMDTNKLLVWPIFYMVDPSDVRHQRKSYAEAMTEHEERFANEREKVVKWRSALSHVASFKGWECKSESDGYEYKYIQEIVDMTVTKLQRDHIDVGENVIGHRSRIEEVKSLLDSENNDKVCMLGIHGTGGIGKTTLAKALYNLMVDDFECGAFVGDVRESSNGRNNMLRLQEKLLSQLLKEKDIKLCSVDEGAARMKHRLCCQKVLMVLDDVDKREQLEKLAGGCDWFGCGSRIIITTRDKHLLKSHKIEKSYEVKLLDEHEALELFCWNAFKMSQPPTSYEIVSNGAVLYANGLPLALKVIGCHLFDKSVEECECALEQYERIPGREIHDILKVSYDCLEENAKFVFLDIACFFKGRKLEYVEPILAACDFGAKYNIGVLVDKSLLTIEMGGLMMHDLIQDMGKEIVRQEAPSKPGKRSRLFHPEDVIRVLTENSGSSNIEGILLDSLEKEEIEWSGTAFKKMKNLRILIIEDGVQFSVGPSYLPNSLIVLKWNNYPSESLPCGFSPRKLTFLSLPNSFVRLERTLQKFRHLVEIDLCNCKFITHVPDMSGVPSLTRMILSGCENLMEIHESVGFLKHLSTLNASRCVKLTSFLPQIWLPSLGKLDVSDCKKLERFPEIVGEMNKLLYLYVVDTGIQELPQSIGNLTGLYFVEMKFMDSLREGSAQVGDSFTRFQNFHLLPAMCWPKLGTLALSRCGLSDEDLEVILKCSPNLHELIVPENNFACLPTCIKESVFLAKLVVRGCSKLQEIPELPSRTCKVKAGFCPHLTSESKSKLWSKVLMMEEICYEIVMPETKIPDWFDHCCDGDTLLFWTRSHKLPTLALALIIKQDNNRIISQWETPLGNFYRGIQFEIFVNGCTIGYMGTSVLTSEIADDHVVLWSAEDLYPSLIKDIDLKHGWNHVEVKCQVTDPAFAIRECGAYVIRQEETNMDDIQFNSPYEGQ